MSETALTDAFIYDGIRTPFGRHAGALRRSDQTIFWLMSLER